MTGLLGKLMRNPATIAVVCGAGGLAAGFLSGSSAASVTAPTEHKGISVELLGTIPPEMIERSVGLEGHQLMVRSLTVEPGGHIAKHDHVGRPGLVAMTGGELVDVRETGEQKFIAGSGGAVIEDEDTVHWLYNPGDEPATAILCDLRPPKQ